MGCVSEETKTVFVECGDEGVLKDCPGVGILDELDAMVSELIQNGRCLDFCLPP